MDDLIGLQLGQYQILAPLGRGAMATVYRAYQASMDRQVALKVLPRHFAAEPQFRARFQQEVRVLARLQHPHILPVFDAGEAAGYPYLAMPLVSGGTLFDRLRGRPLPAQDILRVMAQVGDALDYAHSQGLIHRDVKPSNILIDARFNCLLSDFGVAKILEVTTRLTGTGGLLGTPQYMSPEQGRGEALGPASDLYALGVVLYELATGRVPFEGTTPVAVITQHVSEPLPSARALNPELPETVERVIVRALAKPPEARFPCGRALVEALSVAYDAGRTRAHVSPPLVPDAATVLEPPPAALAGRPWVWLLVVGAVTLAGAFGLGGLAWAGANLLRSAAAATVTVAPTVTAASTATASHPPPSATWTEAPSPAATQAPAAVALPAADTPTPTATVAPSPTPLVLAGRVAFYSLRSGNPDLYVMAASGGDLRQVTSRPSDERVPYWAPDGASLAYYTNADGDYELAVVDLATGAIRQVTFNACQDYAPQWAPNRAELVFYSDCDGNREIYRIRSDGTGLVQLTFTTDVYNWFPTWSPDGRQIAFASNRTGEYQLYVINSDGSGLQALGPGCIPDWSPDGTRLAYTSRCDGSGDLWVVNLDGSGARQLTTDPAGDTSPAWSPDGRAIVFNSQRSGDWDLYVIDLQGVVLSRLTDDPAADQAPVWAP